MPGSWTLLQSRYHFLKTGFFLPCAQNKWDWQWGEGHCISLLLSPAHQKITTLFNILACQKHQRDYFKVKSSLSISEYMHGILCIHIAYAWLLHKCLNCCCFPLMSLDFRNVLQKNLTFFIEQNRIWCWSLNRNCILDHTARLCSETSKNSYMEHTLCLLITVFPWRNWAQNHLWYNCCELSRGVFSLFFFGLITLNTYKKTQKYLEVWTLCNREQQFETVEGNLTCPQRMSTNTIYLTWWN